MFENLTANGAILNYDVVEGDGVYINYKDGVDLSVTMGCSRSGAGYMQTCYSLFGVG